MSDDSGAPAPWKPPKPHDYDESNEFEVATPRSFVSMAKPSKVNDVSDSDSGPSVRAYLVTSGRTTSSLVLGFESMVSISSSAKPSDSLRFERARVFSMCLQSGAQSIAELSARLGVPIGVAKVIAGDLVHEGFLNVHDAQVDLSNDVIMLRRLIHGVRAL